MKKIMFAAAIFAAVSFASCGNKDNNANDSLDTLGLIEDTTLVEAVDTANQETAVVEQVNETAIVAEQPAAKK